MRFALLGLDAATAAFCESAVAGGDRCAAYLAESNAGAAPFLKAATKVDRMELLPKVDYLVVGGSPAECGQRLSAALLMPTMPLVVATPAGTKPETLYEFSVARTESGIRSLFLSPEFGHPATAETMRWLDDARSGSPRWIEMQLPFDPSAALVTRFSHGWTMLREVVGEILSITASTPGQAAEQSDKRYDQVVVGFESERGIMGAVRYIKDRTHPAVRIETSTGLLEWELGESHNDASRLHWIADNDENSAEIRPDNLGDRWLRQWRELQAADDKRFSLHALRQLELADAVERSLKRRRPVALDQEEFSAAAGFKSVMTTWGCGLLWATMAIAILAAAGVPLVKYLVPPALAIFLALQLFGLALRPKP